MCVVSQTLFLSVVPIPAKPIVADALSASIIGGIFGGAGRKFPDEYTYF